MIVEAIWTLLTVRCHAIQNAQDLLLGCCRFNRGITFYFNKGDQKNLLKSQQILEATVLIFK